MGCGASRVLEDQEVTMEDHTREGQMSSSDEGSSSTLGKSVGTVPDTPSETPTIAHDEDRILTFREEQIDSSADEMGEPYSTRNGNVTIEDEVEELSEAALSAMMNPKHQRNKLDAIEKMEGVNASFMRRTNSLRASCSFKSEDIRDLDLDENNEEGDMVNPLPRNPWDMRNMTRSVTSASSKKSVASQSAVGVGFPGVVTSPNHRSNHARSSACSTAGAFLSWESHRDTPGALERIANVTFLDGSVVVSQDAKHKRGLQLYDVTESGKPSGILGAAWVNATRGVCVSMNEESMANVVAVVDPLANTVKFLSGIGDSIGSWKQGVFKAPSGVAVCSDGKYVVTDTSAREKAVHLFTEEGKLIKNFGLGFFESPTHVCVDSSDRIIVTEQSSSTVVIFDKNGKLILDFGRQGKVDGKLSFPGGVAVDSLDNILVADTENYRVSLFSSDGIFIKNVLSQLSYKPVSVAMNDFGHLAVVSDNSVHLYQTFQQKAFLL